MTQPALIQPQTLQTPQTSLATSVYTQEQLATIQSLGFISARERPPQRLVVSEAGLEKTGKTHLPLTGRGPHFVFSIDLGTEGVVEKFVRAGAEVYVYQTHIQRTLPPGVTQSQMHDYWRYQWEDLKTKLYQAYCLNPGTVFIDTMTEAYELCRLANFGKLDQVMPHHYGIVYQDLKGIITWAYDHPSASTVYSHKMGLKYGTQELEVKGWHDMEYQVQLNLRNGRINSEVAGEFPRFLLQVKDCRANPFTNGYVLEGEQFNLQYLEWFVHQWVPRTS